MSAPTLASAFSLTEIQIGIGIAAETEVTIVAADTGAIATRDLAPAFAPTSST